MTLHKAMHCRVITKSGKLCGRPIKLLGCCGIHASYYACDGGVDPRIEQYTRELATIVEEYLTTFTQAEKLGLDIQGPYHGNLCLPPMLTPQTHPIVKRCILALEGQRVCLERYVALGCYRGLLSNLLHAICTHLDYKRSGILYTSPIYELCRPYLVSILG